MSALKNILVANKDILNLTPTLVRRFEEKWCSWLQSPSPRFLCAVHVSALSALHTQSVCAQERTEHLRGSDGSVRVLRFVHNFFFVRGG